MSALESQLRMSLKWVKHSQQNRILEVLKFAETHIRQGGQWCHLT